MENSGREKRIGTGINYPMHSLPSIEKDWREKYHLRALRGTYSVFTNALFIGWDDGEGLKLCRITDGKRGYYLKYHICDKEEIANYEFVSDEELVLDALKGGPIITAQMHLKEQSRKGVWGVKRGQKT